MTLLSPTSPEPQSVVLLWPEIFSTLQWGHTSCSNHFLCLSCTHHVYLLLDHGTCSIRALRPVSCGCSVFIPACEVLLSCQRVYFLELSSCGRLGACSLQRRTCHLMSEWRPSSLVQISVTVPVDEAAADGCCVLHCLVYLSVSIKYLLIRTKGCLVGLSAALNTVQHLTLHFSSSNRAVKYESAHRVLSTPPLCFHFPPCADSFEKFIFQILTLSQALEWWMYYSDI